MQRRHFLWYSTLFLAGCVAANSTQHSSSSIALPPKLRFAVTDVSGLEDLQQDYEPLRVALEEAIETDIEFFPVNNYADAAIALKRGNLELALAGPSEYLVITTRTNAVPILGVTRPTYYSVIAVPTESGIQALTELKGKSIAMSDIGSTSGHLGPTKLLMDAGLDPQTDITIRMLGDEGSAEALKRGEVDAWGGAFTDYQDLLQDEAGSFSILVQGPMLPNDVFVASSSLDPRLIDVMRERLLRHQAKIVEAIALYQQSKYAGSELVLANDEDYDTVRDVYEAIGQGEFLQ